MIRHVREISCLACGRDLGRIEAVRGEVRRVPAGPSPSTADAVLKRGYGLVCGRCGGRALVGPLDRIFSYTITAVAGGAPDEARTETPTETPEAA